MAKRSTKSSGNTSSSSGLSTTNSATQQFTWFFCIREKSVCESGDQWGEYRYAGAINLGLLTIQQAQQIFDAIKEHVKINVISWNLDYDQRIAQHYVFSDGSEEDLADRTFITEYGRDDGYGTKTKFTLYQSGTDDYDRHSLRLIESDKFFRSSGRLKKASSSLKSKNLRAETDWEVLASALNLANIQREGLGVENVSSKKRGRPRKSDTPTVKARLVNYLAENPLDIGRPATFFPICLDVDPLRLEAQRYGSRFVKMPNLQKKRKKGPKMSTEIFWSQQTIAIVTMKNKEKCRIKCRLK